MKVDRRVVRAALGVVLAAGAGWALLNRDELDLSALETSVQALGMWAPAAFIGFFALATSMTKSCVSPRSSRDRSATFQPPSTFPWAISRRGSTKSEDRLRAK